MESIEINRDTPIKFTFDFGYSRLVISAREVFDIVDQHFHAQSKVQEPLITVKVVHIIEKP